MPHQLRILKNSSTFRGIELARDLAMVSVGFSCGFSGLSSGT